MLHACLAIAPADRPRCAELRCLRFLAASDCSSAPLGHHALASEGATHPTEPEGLVTSAPAVSKVAGDSELQWVAKAAAKAAATVGEGMFGTVTTTIGVIAAGATVGAKGVVVGVEAIASGATVRESLAAAGGAMGVEAKTACSDALKRISEKARTAMHMQPALGQTANASPGFPSPPTNTAPSSLHQAADQAQDWQCGACTLLNMPCYLACDACGRERDAPAIGLESSLSGSDSPWTSGLERRQSAAEALAMAATSHESHLTRAVVTPPQESSSSPVDIIHRENRNSSGMLCLPCRTVGCWLLSVVLF